MGQISQIASVLGTTMATVNSGTTHGTDWTRVPTPRASRPAAPHAVDSVHLSGPPAAEVLADHLAAPQAQARLVRQHGGGNGDVYAARTSNHGVAEDLRGALKPASRWGRKYTAGKPTAPAPRVAESVRSTGARAVRAHSLDTGHPGSPSAGEPYVRVQSQAQLDRMIVSHSTNKHGGYDSVERFINRSVSSSKAPEVCPATSARVSSAGRPTESAPTVKSSAAGKLLPIAGFVASAFQVKAGTEQIRKGEYVEGGSNVAGGTANGTSCVAFLAGAHRVAMRAGGVGAGFDGANDIYQGVRRGDNFRVAEGTAKTTAGALMLSGSAAAPHAATAYVAYTGTRAAMQVKVWGDATGDAAVTSVMDRGMNREVNQKFDALSQRNRNNLEFARDIAYHPQHLTVSTEGEYAILGLHQHMEDCRQVGDQQGEQTDIAALARLRRAKHQLDTAHTADYGTH